MDARIDCPSRCASSGYTPVQSGATDIVLCTVKEGDKTFYGSWIEGVCHYNNQVSSHLPICYKSIDRARLGNSSTACPCCSPAGWPSRTATPAPALLSKSSSSGRSSSRAHPARLLRPRAPPSAASASTAAATSASVCGALLHRLRHHHCGRLPTRRWLSCRLCSLVHTRRGLGPAAGWWANGRCYTKAEKFGPQGEYLYSVLGLGGDYQVKLLCRQPPDRRRRALQGELPGELGELEAPTGAQQRRRLAAPIGFLNSQYTPNCDYTCKLQGRVHVLAGAKPEQVRERAPDGPSCHAVGTGTPTARGALLRALPLHLLAAGPVLHQPWWHSLLG